VLFDIFGTVVYRPDLEECFTSKEKADKGFYWWFETFNEVEHYQQALKGKLKKLEKDEGKLSEILQTLSTTEEVTA
jgi:DNA-binding PucR family transcriptional regulator